MGDDGRVLDPGVGAERGGHLSGFDAVAADLHLVVGAADDLQDAVGAQPGEVAGAVHAAAGRAAGGGGEAFGGLSRAAQVALGQSVAREVELAGHSCGQRDQAPAEYQGAGVPQRCADVRSLDVRRVEGAGGGPDGGLGRSVQIDEFRAVGDEPPSEVGGEGLAPGEGEEPAHRVGLGVQECPPQGGGGLHDGGAGGVDESGEESGVADLFPVGEDHGAAGDQRQEQFEDGDVEADGGDREEPFATAESQGVGHAEQEVDDGGPGDDHALGAAGGARGVDDVRRRPAVRGPGRERFGVGGRAHRRGIVQEERGARVRVEGAGSGAVGDQERRCGVGQQDPDPLGREVGVDGEVGGPGPGDGEQGGEEVGAPGQADADEDAGARPASGQQPGQPGGPCVELRVGDLVRSADQGGTGGGPGGLGGAQFGERGGRDGVRLLRRRDRFGGCGADGDDGAFGVGGDLVEEVHQRPGEAVGGGGVPEVGAVFELPGRPGGRVLADGALEVELGGPGRDEAGPAGLAGQYGPGGKLLPYGEQHLEQRAHARQSGRVDLGHDAFQREALVSEGGEVGVPGPLQQVEEAGCGAQIGAQRQRVDEEADAVAEHHVVASRDGRADDEVVAAAELGKGGGERGVQHHEGRGAGASGQRPYTLVQFCVDAEVVGAGGAAGPGGPGSGPWQGQLFGGSAHPGAPVLRVRVRVRGHDLSLPEREVDVVHGQARQVGVGAAEAGGVGGGEVVEEGRQRPFVGGDVVQDEQQDLPDRRTGFRLGGLRLGGLRLCDTRLCDTRLGDLRFCGEQHRAQRGFALDGERPSGLRRDTLRQPRFAHADFTQHGFRRRDVQHVLPGLSVLDGQHGSQDLVAGGDIGECAAQRGRVEPACDVEREGNVVRAVLALAAGEEPQPSLPEGEGRSRGPGPPDQRRHADPPAGDLGVLRPVRLLQDGGQPGRGGVVEQGAYGQFGPGPGVERGHQSGGGQRVAAEEEEVVVGRGSAPAEHVGEQVAQQRLGPGTRGAPGLGSGGGPDGGQRGPVGLAVRGQRQPVQRHEVAGHQVLGEPLGERVAQRVGPAAVAARRLGRGLPPRGHENAVRGERQVAARCGDGRDDGLRDRGVRQEGGLDLAGLHAVAADLHLVVGTAQHLQGAVVAEPGQVTGPVHPVAGRPVGVGDEAFGGECGTAEVAVGDPVPREVQFAGHPDGGGGEGAVQDVGAGAAHGPADVRRGAPAEDGRGGPDGGLGRPVEVDEPVRVPGQDVRQVGGQRLSPAERAQAAQGVRGRVGEDAPERGGRLHHGGRARPDERGEGEGVGHVVVGREHHGGPAEERNEEFEGGDVEGDGGDREQTVLAGQVEQPAHGGQEVGEGLAGHDDALGAAGGSGGVDDIGRVARVAVHRAAGPVATSRISRTGLLRRDRAVGDPGHGFRTGLRAQVRGRARAQVQVRTTARVRAQVRVRVGARVGERPVQGDGEPGQIRAPGVGPVGDQQEGAAVRQHVPQPVGRVARVQRYVRGARRRHGQQGDQERFAPGKGDGDQAAPPRTPGPERRCQPAGPVRQLRVGEVGVAAAEGYRVRGATGLGPEALDEAGGRDCFGLLVGRGVELLQNAQAFGLAQETDAGPGEGGFRMGEPVQEGGEAVEVGVQLLGSVQLGAAVQDEVEAGETVRAAPAAHGDVEIIDGSGGQRVHHARTVAEGEVRGERLDVQLGADEASAVPEQLQVAPELLAPVALVAALTAQGRGDTAQEVADGLPFVDGDPERDDVDGGDGGAGEDAARAVADGETDDGFGRAGEPGQVQRPRGGHGLGPGGAGPLGEGGEPFGVVGAEGEAAAQEAGGDAGGRGAGRGRRVRPVGQQVPPEPGVEGVLFGCGVAAVLLDRVAERAERRRAGFGARARVAVELGDAFGDASVAVGVEQDVVAAVVPQPLLVAGAQQGVPVERTVLDVDRGGAFFLHPGQGGGARVVGGAEVEDVGARGKDRAGLLVDAVAVGGEAYGETVGLVDGPGHGRRERALVQRSRQLDVFSGEIRGVRRVDSLRGPETELGLGQRQAFAVGAHAHSPGRKPRPDLPVRWTGSWAGRAGGHADGTVGATARRWVSVRVRARSGSGLGREGAPGPADGAGRCPGAVPPSQRAPGGRGSGVRSVAVVRGEVHDRFRLYDEGTHHHHVLVLVDVAVVHEPAGRAVERGSDGDELGGCERDDVLGAPLGRGQRGVLAPADRGGGAGSVSAARQLEEGEGADVVQLTAQPLERDRVEVHRVRVGTRRLLQAEESPAFGGPGGDGEPHRVLEGGGDPPEGADRAVLVLDLDDSVDGELALGGLGLLHLPEFGVLGVDGGDDDEAFGGGGRGLDRCEGGREALRRDERVVPGPGGDTEFHQVGAGSRFGQGVDEPEASAAQGGEVHQEVGAFTGGDRHAVGDRVGPGQQSAVRADQPEGVGGEFPALLVEDLQQVGAVVRGVEGAEAVPARLHLQVRPDHPVDQVERSGEGADQFIGVVGDDDALVEEVAGERPVVVEVEIAVEEDERDLPVAGGQSQPPLLLVPDEVGARAEAGHHVEVRDVHGVVVVPEPGGGLLVGILGELGGARQYGVLRPAVVAAAGDGSVQVHHGPRGQRGDVRAHRGPFAPRAVPHEGQLGVVGERDPDGRQRVVAGEVVLPGDTEPAAAPRLDGRPDVRALVRPQPGVRQAAVEAYAGRAHRDGQLPLASADHPGNGQRVQEGHEGPRRLRRAGGVPGGCPGEPGPGLPGLADGVGQVVQRGAEGRRHQGGPGRRGGGRGTAGPAGEGESGAESHPRAGHAGPDEEPPAGDQVRQLGGSSHVGSAAMLSIRLFGRRSVQFRST
ncbi:hypothetical protein SPW_6618 [Streptomyces sp. W007]|nr:hypothetical protein SPW_6618 [Streptomyces sp. W007]